MEIPIPTKNQIKYLDNNANKIFKYIRYLSSHPNSSYFEDRNTKTIIKGDNSSTPSILEIEIL